MAGSSIIKRPERWVASVTRLERGGHRMIELQLVKRAARRQVDIGWALRTIERDSVGEHHVVSWRLLVVTQAENPEAHAVTRMFQVGGA